MADLKEGVVTPKQMVSEQLRMNSFKNVPYDFTNNRFLWASTLAKAGFYYSPTNNETVCFVCNLKKPLFSWVKGTNPIQVHRAESPNCEFITGRSKDNVPFLTNQQRNDKLHYLAPRNGARAAAEASGGRLVADSPQSPPTVDSFAHDSSDVVQSMPTPRRPELSAEDARRHESPFQSLPLPVNPSPEATVHIDMPAANRPTNATDTGTGRPPVTGSSSSNTRSTPGTDQGPASLPVAGNPSQVSLPYQGGNNPTVAIVMQGDGSGQDPLLRMRSEEQRLYTYPR